MRKRFLIAFALTLSAAAVMLTALSASAAPPAAIPTVTPGWVTGLQGGSGSTVGPDGALYVPEPAAGRISRVDPKSGAVTTFASGLPTQVIPLGGVMDVAFIGETAYALVTLVGDPLIGGDDIDGVYRVDGPNSFTVVADIGAFAIANPPDADIFLVTGVQYAMEPFRGGFLVTDGHHNRVYRVALDGTVSELLQLGNVVPTGLAARGNTVYMAEAGPLPHAPANGKVVSFEPGSSSTTQVAAGAPLLVDVEFGRGRDLFALSQGVHTVGDAGSPADANTGSLVTVNGDGTFTSIATGIDRPTSLEVIGTSAYVVTLTGQIWRVDNISSPPFGK
jgi:sugar lactone lactonase YvrE